MTPPLLAALGLAAGTQFALAAAFGSVAIAARDDWSVALVVYGSLTLSGAAVALASWAARDLPADRLPGIAVALAATGILMRVPYFGAGAMLEDDHFRYLLDGAMVARGLSPYALAPEAVLQGAPGVPADLLVAGRDAIGAINFPGLRTIYPGGAQALFALAHALAPWSLDALRAAIFALEGLTALLIWRLLRACGRSPLATALYWCNPLFAFCLTGQAHVDAALAPPLLIALLAAHRRASALSGLALGLAAGIKLWPILIAPLILRALWPDRRALAVFALVLGATTSALCAPLLAASLSADAGLSVYAGGWSVNNAPFAWAVHGARLLLGAQHGEVVLRGLLVLAAAVASLAVAARRPGGLEDILGRAAFLAALLFYLSPAQFPWYAAWFLPLAAACAAWILAAAAVGLPVYYLFFPLAADGLAGIHAYALALLHLAPVLLAALVARRSSASRVVA
jgi:alpha-1,6-mannosyltransferase